MNTNLLIPTNEKLISDWQVLGDLSRLVDW